MAFNVWCRCALQVKYTVCVHGTTEEAKKGTSLFYYQPPDWRRGGVPEPPWWGVKVWQTDSCWFHVTLQGEAGGLCYGHWQIAHAVAFVLIIMTDVWTATGLSGIYSLYTSF